MKPHVLFTAVSLAAALLGGAGCNGDAPEPDPPLPVLENAGQLTLAGGSGSATTKPRTTFRPAGATAKRS